MGDRQTDRQTHTQTDRANHSIVAHFVRGNYNKVIDSSGNGKVKSHIFTESRLARTGVQGATIRALLSISF